MTEIVKQKVKALPQHPGVYIFKNNKGSVVYVGKAKSLKNRVSSYFNRNLELGTKTSVLVSKICDLDTILTFSEIEALILEAELIRKYRPKYNILLKDDKSYLYIVIRNERLQINTEHLKLPKVITARKTDLLPRDTIFGPYPDGRTAKYILRTIRKIFPFRDCTPAKFIRYHRSEKPCLYGHIGLCQAPCLSSVNKDLYKGDIKRIKRFLSGEGSAIVDEYTRKMSFASKEQEYEKAQYYRDIIKQFEYIRSSPTAADKYIENPNLIEDTANKAMAEVQRAIPILSSLPKRIECYDISNISGKESVGSMVVAINGQIDKNEYRKYKIKTKSSPDDFFMMQEVLRRRLLRETVNDQKVKKWGRPDLIILDGGKGQVSSVLEIMQELNVQIPLIGIAKRLETLIYKDSEGFKEIRIPKNNSGLQLIIYLRNEAHRFAQNYHHYLRIKKIHV